MDEPQSDAAYALVEQAIRYLRRHARRQPGLAELAAAVGLSEFHLQRVFGGWAGVSPKRFLQCLTKEHAKAALRESADVLDAALSAGLSGPGRLHDLLVTCDAVSPGEVRSLGAALVIRHGIHATPFGPALIAVTERGVCRFEFLPDDGAQAALAKLRAEWPLATLVEDRAHTAAAAAAMFPVTPGPRRLHLWLRGTNFQTKVWEALLRIPPGRVLTYARLAGAIGSPGAARAVGSACAANTIAVLIPCHRVIRETGELGDYRWGIERKNALIAWEAARRDPPPG